MKEMELGRAYADGEIVFREGEKGDVMYVIQSGKVKIVKTSTSKDVLLATLEKGDIFGEMALFDRLPRSATAVAESDTNILRIDKKKLFSTISKNPTVVLKILESMSSRIRQIDAAFAVLRRKQLSIVNSNGSMEKIFNSVLLEIGDSIPAENGSIMFLDEKDDLLHIRTAYGFESHHKTLLTAGEGIAGHVIREGTIEVINDVALDSRYKPGSLDIRSMICAPLRYKGTSFGVLNFSSPSENQFKMVDLKLLQSLISYASIALKHAIDLSELQNTTDEALNHASLLSI